MNEISIHEYYTRILYYYYDNIYAHTLIRVCMYDICVLDVNGENYNTYINILAYNVIILYSIRTCIIDMSMVSQHIKSEQFFFWEGWGLTFFSFVIVYFSIITITHRDTLLLFILYN